MDVGPISNRPVKPKHSFYMMTEMVNLTKDDKKMKIHFFLTFSGGGEKFTILHKYDPILMLISQILSVKFIITRRKFRFTGVR